MGYNSAIPQPSDARAQSQSQILSNFQTINKIWADNHFPLTGDPQFKGMHNVLTIRPQSSDPTTIAGQVALYNKLVSSIPQLFFRPQNNATPIQLTASSLSTVATGGSGATQYSFIAGPFLIYFGFLIGAGAARGTVVTLSPGSGLLYVGLTGAGVGLIPPTGPRNPIPTNISGTSFTIDYNPLINPPIPIIYYMAIGLP